MCNLRCWLLIIVIFVSGVASAKHWFSTDANGQPVLEGKVCCSLPNVKGYKPNATASDYIAALASDYGSMGSAYQPWGQKSALDEDESYNRNVVYQVHGEYAQAKILNDYEHGEKDFTKYVCKHASPGAKPANGCSKKKVHYFSRIVHFECGQNGDFTDCKISDGGSSK